MRRRLSRWRCLFAFTALVVAAIAQAVPPGYRYVGSRVVTAGRVVYWYWNPDTLERAVDNRSFVARMYARAVDVGQERPYAAEIRCDTRTYREFGAQGPYQRIEDDEPIAAVWRAGCDAGRALTLAERGARLGMSVAPAPSAPNIVATAPPAVANPAPVSPVPPERVDGSSSVSANAGSSTGAKSAPSSAPASTPPRPAPVSEPDARRADACVRFAETKSGAGAAAGEATIGNACAFPVEVTLCYKGGRGGPYDCPPKARGRRSDSLPPGVTHVLPDYRRATHKGIALVACRGTMGTVIPRLDEGADRSGCTS